VTALDEGLKGAIFDEALANKKKKGAKGGRKGEGKSGVR
jgi:hypothetical protein